MTASTEPQPATRAALTLAYEVLVRVPAGCRYHGTKFDFLGTWQGEPRCDSCKQPARVVKALRALRDALGFEE